MTDNTGNTPQSRDHEASRSDRPARRFEGRGRDQQRGRRDGRDGRGGHRGRSHGGRDDQRRGNRGQREDRPQQDESENQPTHNPSDLRSANRPDRGRSPNIDDDVTGRELDKGVQRQLGALDEQNRPWVQKHLVMAERLLEDDPDLAFEHALAASRRGGRLAVVREAAGMTAYAAGKFSDALREFRTYRRISGDNSHLPEMVDAERALGRVDKAFEMVEEADLEQLPVRSRVELAIVVAGIHLDQEEPERAVKTLEIPQLNPRRGFSYSPRLFSAYAQALEAAGRTKESQQWSNLAGRAERALGLDIAPEPEILDLDEVFDETPPVRARDIIPPASTSYPRRGRGGDK